MTSPKVSIIIPAYNNAEYLGEAIQSVLGQTYPVLEVIVVNDASPDEISEVIGQFHDPRLRYIVHETNQGLSAARNTGIQASEGEFIALLDGDDYFHPEKLEAHVEFHAKHPDIGVTYNARYELNHSSSTIRELWRPPCKVTLSDLIFIYPFSPSDMVLRREWLFRVNMFDRHYVYVGEDFDLNCRLALAGCKFASVDRPLNYRRYHSGRVIKDLQSTIEYTIRPLNAAVSDPRCPAEIRALRERAIAKHYLLWSAIAFTQDDTAFGQEYLTAAIRGDPSFLAGNPCPLTETLISYSIVDESMNHELLLRRMVQQLPAELSWQEDQLDWAVARGYLLRGTRAMMWGRTEDAREHFRQAAACRAQLDESCLRNLAAQLISYEAEFGFDAADKVLRNLSFHLEQIGDRSQVRWLRGCFLINLAFRNYRAGKHSRVPRDVARALASDPQYLVNRGVLSILFRSIVGVPPPSDA